MYYLTKMLGYKNGILFELFMTGKLITVKQVKKNSVLLHLSGFSL